MSKKILSLFDYFPLLNARKGNDSPGRDGTTSSPSEEGLTPNRSTSENRNSPNKKASLTKRGLTTTLASHKPRSKRGTTTTTSPSSDASTPEKRNSSTTDEDPNNNNNSNSNKYCTCDSSTTATSVRGKRKIPSSFNSPSLSSAAKDEGGSKEEDVEEVDDHTSGTTTPLASALLDTSKPR